MCSSKGYSLLHQSQPKQEQKDAVVATATVIQNSFTTLSSQNICKELKGILKTSDRDSDTVDDTASSSSNNGSTLNEKKTKRPSLKYLFRGASFRKKLCKIEQTQEETRSSKKAPTVKFHELQIRVFPQILGDHPCCQTGLPLSLGWKHTSEHTKSIDEFEKQDHMEANLSSSLRISAIRRWEILKDASIDRFPPDETRTNSSAEDIGRPFSLNKIKLASRPTCQKDLFLVGDVDGQNNVQIDHLQSSPRTEATNYSENELKRAGRKIMRERESRRRKKAIRKFFETPI